MKIIFPLGKWKWSPKKCLDKGDILKDKLIGPFARISVRCVVVVVMCIVVGSYRMLTHPSWMNGSATK